MLHDPTDHMYHFFPYILLFYRIQGDRSVHFSYIQAIPFSWSRKESKTKNWTTLLKTTTIKHIQANKKFPSILKWYESHLDIRTWRKLYYQAWNEAEKNILNSKHSRSHGKDFHRRLTGRMILTVYRGFTYWMYNFSNVSMEF